MEKKASIRDIVANVDVVEKMIQDERLKERYLHLVALAQKEPLKPEDYTFCRRFVMMQMLYR